MIKNIVIHTERLKEIPINMDYLDSFYENYSKEDAFYMDLLIPEDKEAAINFINNCIKETEEGTDLNLAVLDKITGEFIGYVAAYYINTKEPELGLWIKSSKKRLGYGKEALISIVDWIKDNCEFDRIVCPIDKDNKGSRKIQEYFNAKIHKTYLHKSCTGRTLNIVEYWIEENY